MSIGAGALALKRIQVLTAPRETPLAWIVEKLQTHLVRSIGMDEAKEVSSGWCHPFSGEPHFEDFDSLVYDGALVFGMRTDTKKIPGTLLRLQLKSAFEEIARGMDTSARGAKKRLSKKAKDTIRDRIKDELLKRTLPHIRLVEIVWRLDSNEIWLTSASPAVTADFEKLFNETFGLPFVHVNPGTAAIDFDRVLLGQDVPLDKLLDLVPERLLRTQEGRQVGESSAAHAQEAPF